MSPLKRTRLSLESLDQRIVPAVVNLSSVGASGSANGAIFQQRSAGTDDDTAHTFLKIKESSLLGTLLTAEEGYNTNARPLQLDTVGGSATRALKLSEVPVVTINGKEYREFLLTTNQLAISPTITLDELRFYVDTSATKQGYNQSNNKLGGMTAVYDLDKLGNNTTNNSVRINDNLNRTDADVRVLIPSSVFGSNKDAYVYLYSSFSSLLGTSLLSAGESWAVRDIPVTPPTTPPSSSVGKISGYVLNASGVGIANIRITISGDGPDGPIIFPQSNDVDWSVTTNADGYFEIGDLPQGTYQISVTSFQGESYDSLPGTTSDSSTPDDAFTGYNLIGGINLAPGETGINFNFRRLGGPST